MALTFNDIVKEARSIPVFSGSDTYSLSSYILEVETLLGLVQDEQARSYINRILHSKIQGNAAMTIRRLTNPTWDQIKLQLIKSFGVAENYLKLKEQADQIPDKNVSQIYSKLALILDKLNMKYSLDPSHPAEFQPRNNKRSILDKFLNKIDRVDSMFIRSRNLNTLEEAYQALVETGLKTYNDSYRPKKHHNNYNNTAFSHNNHNNKNHNFNNNYSNQNTNRTNNNPANSHYYQNNNKNNFNNSNRYRNQSGNYRSTQRFNSGNFRNNRNYYNNSDPNAMDVDYYNPNSMDLEHNTTKRVENFPLTPPTIDYP